MGAALLRVVAVINPTLIWISTGHKVASISRRNIEAEARGGKSDYRIKFFRNLLNLVVFLSSWSKMVYDSLGPS